MMLHCSLQLLSAPDSGAPWERSGDALLALHGQLERQPEARQRELTEHAMRLCSLVVEAKEAGGPLAPPPPASHAAEIMARIAVNGHTICDEELAEVRTVRPGAILTAVKDGQPHTFSHCGRWASACIRWRRSQTTAAHRRRCRPLVSPVRSHFVPFARSRWARR